MDQKKDVPVRGITLMRQTALVLAEAYDQLSQCAHYHSVPRGVKWACARMAKRGFRLAERLQRRAYQMGQK